MTLSVRRALPGIVLTLILAGPCIAMAADDPAPARPVLSGTKSKMSPPAAGKPRRVAVQRGRQTVGRAVRSASTAADTATGWRQVGIASWYGGTKWQGKMTASGVRYDENALTAAHATLPIGTRVRVTVTGTDRSVIVTITDRPGTRSRIIDLSRAAASSLGILSRGIASVTLTRVEA